MWCKQSLWPGNKTSFTAPVYRRKTDIEEGFIGGGRWKYYVRSSDLYPETQIAYPLNGTEEDRDSVGDEAAVLSKDVAAGLLRMDILTRIQNIFEVAHSEKGHESYIWINLQVENADFIHPLQHFLYLLTRLNNGSHPQMAMICSWVCICRMFFSRKIVSML